MPSFLRNFELIAVGIVFASLIVDDIRVAAGEYLELVLAHGDLLMRADLMVN
jgi:hypothetical protein